jgi:hypothetical protein
VVQFAAETTAGHGGFIGRVEHVVSGQAAHFATLEESLAFMVQVLSATRAEPQPAPSEEL